MAIIRLKDVTVTRVNRNGHGVQVTESNESGGKTYKTRYTVWFKEASGLREGDRVSVSGFLSAKVGEPWAGDDGVERRSVELSVNSPRIEDGDAPTGHQSSPAVSEPEPWATTAPPVSGAAQGHAAGEANGFGFEESAPF